MYIERQGNVDPSDYSHPTGSLTPFVFHDQLHITRRIAFDVHLVVEIHMLDSREIPPRFLIHFYFKIGNPECIVLEANHYQITDFMFRIYTQYLKKVLAKCRFMIILVFDTN